MNIVKSRKEAEQINEQISHYAEEMLDELERLTQGEPFIGIAVALTMATSLARAVNMSPEAYVDGVEIAWNQIHEQPRK